MGIGLSVAAKLWQTTSNSVSHVGKLAGQRKQKRWQIYLIIVLTRRRHSLSVEWTGLDHFGLNKVVKSIRDVVSSKAIYRGPVVRGPNNRFVHKCLDVQTIRCFIGVHGTRIVSDQIQKGTNFVGAKNELTKALIEVDKEQLATYLAQCEFRMNVPNASHMRGVWEWQIMTVKCILSCVLSQNGGSLCDFFFFKTSLYKAMSIVSSRPLPTDSINNPNSLEPLTTNHLVTMKTTVPLPLPGKFVAEDLYAKKDGTEFSTWLNSFGEDGGKSIWQTLHSDSAGMLLGEMEKMEM